jgi:hypothetical protein
MTPQDNPIIDDKGIVSGMCKSTYNLAITDALIIINKMKLYSLNHGLKDDYWLIDSYQLISKLNQLKK